MSAIVKAVLVAIIGINVYFYFHTSAVTPKLSSPVIDTKSGKVQGAISVSRGGRRFFEYLGIPYAKPPVGDLRFEVINISPVKYSTQTVILISIFNIFPQIVTTTR